MPNYKTCPPTTTQTVVQSFAYSHRHSIVSHGNLPWTPCDFSFGPHSLKESHVHCIVPFISFFSMICNYLLLGYLCVHLVQVAQKQGFWRSPKRETPLSLLSNTFIWINTWWISIFICNQVTTTTKALDSLWKPFQESIELFTSIHIWTVSWAIPFCIVISKELSVAAEFSFQPSDFAMKVYAFLMERSVMWYNQLSIKGKEI